MQKTIILSLGGSLIVPDEFDADFLKNFKKTIEKYASKGCKFAIICGGGKTARNLQKAASKVSKLNNEDLDWLGIYATILNAQLVKAIFKDSAEGFIISNPTKKFSFKKNIVAASGWIPGRSTDFDAVILAKNLGVKEIINMSDVDYVYDKDPKKYKNAKKIGKLSWHNFNKFFDKKWRAGMNVPFDPVAAREAQKLRIKVNIIGSDLKNLENVLDGKKFKGTVIE